MAKDQRSQRHIQTHTDKERTMVVLRYTTKKGQSRQYKSKSNGKEQGKKKKKTKNGTAWPIISVEKILNQFRQFCICSPLLNIL